MISVTSITALTAGMVEGVGGKKYPGLLDDWAHVFESHPRELRVYEGFKQELEQLAGTIEQRNASRKYVFNDFNPKYVKCSVSS